MVVKVLSDVTYRVQSEKPKPGRHRQRFVVHFNRLKPCQAPTQETQQEGEPNEVNREQANISDNEEDPMTLTWQPTTQEGEVQPRESAERGGPTWGGRLKRTTHLPDYYASHISQPRGDVLQEGEPCTEQVGDNAQQVGDNARSLHSNRQ